MKKVITFIGLVVLLTLCATPVYAQPALPHAFYGTVTINDSPAPDDTQISATVDEGVTLTTNKNPVATEGGSYGIDSPRLLVQGDGLSGAITFYVNGVEAEGQTATFEAGGGPTRRDLSVTIAAPPPPGVTGVGALPPPAPPPGTTDVTGKVTAAGRFTRSVTATSEDELCTLTIPRDTVGLTEELEPLDEITMVIKDEPPDPPKKAEIVGLAYDFGPDGATFEPAITLEYTYDPDDIPDWVDEEDLVLAYYDEEAGEWAEFPCTVDTATHTITALVSHFTTFAVIARRPVPPPLVAPAAFSVSNLAVKPAEVQPKEAVTITVSLTNTGGTEGSYTVALLINGVKEAEKSVTVVAGESQIVSFSVTKEETGSYTVVVDGLTASFTVVAPVPPAPPPPAPPPVPEVKPPFNWPLVGGIMGVAVVLTLLVFFLVIRPRIKEY